LLYWQVGHRLYTETLGETRAGYGERIVVTVAGKLTAEFGRGFSDRNLRHMIRFSEAFPDREIVYALSRQLGWTHFRSLIYLDDSLKREFSRGRWSSIFAGWRSTNRSPVRKRPSVELVEPSSFPMLLVPLGLFARRPVAAL
jgi:hypothetical protein